MVGSNPLDKEPRYLLESKYRICVFLCLFFTFYYNAKFSLFNTKIEHGYNSSEL